MWFGTAANLKKLSSEDQRVAIGSSSIEPSSSVGLRNLGVYLDSQMTMNEGACTTDRQDMLPSHSTTVGNTATAESRNHRSPRVSSHNQSFGLLQCGTVRFASGHFAATTAGYERRRAFNAQLTTARPHHGGFARATLIGFRCSSAFYSRLVCWCTSRSLAERRPICLIC